MTPESERAFEAWWKQLWSVLPSADAPERTAYLAGHLDGFHARDEECERLRRERDEAITIIGAGITYMPWKHRRWIDVATAWFRARSDEQDAAARAALQEGGEGKP